MELMKEVADQRIFTGVNSQRFLQCFAEFLNGIAYTAESQKEENGQRYTAAATDYYQPFMAEHAYIMENYLVNYAFKNLFPLSGEKHIFDNYVMLIVHYAMIKLLLIGMAGFHKENFRVCMGSGLVMGQLTDEIRQEQLAWAHRRLAALDKMEAKRRKCGHWQNTPPAVGIIDAYFVSHNGWR